MDLPKIKEEKITIEMDIAFAYWLAEYLYIISNNTHQLSSLAIEMYNIIADRVNKSSKNQITLKLKMHQANFIALILSAINISDPYYAIIKNNIIAEIHKKITDEISTY